MEVDAVSRKGRGKEKSGKGKKGGKKGKESHSGKGYDETTTEHSRFEGECRNCGKYGHKAAVCWYKQPPKPQGKGKGTGKSKSKVSESDSSKQVDETWTSNTSTPQPSLSQGNTIGCADERLWIFSLEDSKTRRYMEPRDVRLLKLQLAIDEQSPMRIRPDSLIFLVKRKLQECYVLLNHRQMLREWHTTRHTFHSEIGAHSMLRVVDEVLRTDELW